MSDETQSTTDTEQSIDTEQSADTEQSTDVAPGDDIPAVHQRLVAAPGIELTSDMARIDGQWTTTLFVVGYPDTAITGMLDQALTLPDIEFDYSIHIHPRDSSKTISALEKSIRDLEVKRSRKSESGDVTQIETTKALEDHTAIYEQLIESSQHVFDVSIYLTIRGAERTEVERAVDRIRSNLQSVRLTPTTATYRQDDALVCTSPVGRDTLGQSATMLGGAVGCLFPFSMSTHIEDDGVLMGYHSMTGSPVVVDRFARETGYNCVVMGNTGAGKTFNTVLTLLRRLGKDPDTLVFMADPFGDLGALTEILNGERITVSGSQALNPLEITPTPERVLEANPDLDPYKQTVQKNAVGFVEAFFEMEGISLEGKRGLLSIALRESYRQQGITPDPSTHANLSPTLREVRTVLRDIAEEPLEYIDGDPEFVSEIETDLWRRRASQLRMDLAPFRSGGEYEHLGRQSEVDLHGSDVMYLDMQQVEGEQKTGVMLQLLLHAVYERAKQTAKRVIFAIDEAHYLMRSGANLEFLERAVRHARHYDLSLQFITQTADEFFTDDHAQAAKTIADNCSLKIFHNVAGLSNEDAAEWLGLTQPEAEFVRNARPGSEEYGYSQALIEIGDAGRFPVNVRPLPHETALITDAESADGGDGDRADLGEHHRETLDQSQSSEDVVISENHATEDALCHTENGNESDQLQADGDATTDPRIERRMRILQRRSSSQLLNNIDPVELTGDSGQVASQSHETQTDGGSTDD